MTYKETFEAWLEERPESIKQLVAKYPPGTYTMKEGAPYRITDPGTEVELVSYLEDGNVGVAVKAANKSKDAIEHEKKLGAYYQKTEEEIEAIHNSDIVAHVDPEWLELKKSDFDVD